MVGRDRTLTAPLMATTLTAMADADDAFTLQRRLDDVDLLRRRVINVVGHELRTPVTTVRGLVETLVHADEDTARGEIVPRLLANVRRLEGLLDDMLLASGVTTALPVGSPQAESVAVVFRGAWAAIGEEGVLQLAGDIDATVAVVPGAFGRIAKHVLRNAAHYGEPPVNVRITPHGGATRIEVDSAGEAIGEQDLRLAFEPFFRGEAAVMRVPGFGLGLTVSRLLARQVGGDIELFPGRSGGMVTAIELPSA